MVRRDMRIRKRALRLAYDKLIEELNIGVSARPLQKQCWECLEIRHDIYMQGGVEKTLERDPFKNMCITERRKKVRYVGLCLSNRDIPSRTVLSRSARGSGQLHGTEDRGVAPSLTVRNSFMRRIFGYELGEAHGAQGSSRLWRVSAPR